jgi:hypothetical protein
MDSEQVKVFPHPQQEGIEEKYRYNCTHSDGDKQSA